MRSTRRDSQSARGRWQSIRRWLRYRLVIPLFRSQHPPEYTARGVAHGVFWALTPTVGLQTIEILSVWLFARKVLRIDSSLLQAMIWVGINNPLTMAPFYYVFYVTGLLLMGNADAAQGYAGFIALWDRTSALGWWARMSAISQAIGVPLLVGCVPYAVIGTTLSYRWTLAIVRRRRERMRRRHGLYAEPVIDASGK